MRRAKAAIGSAAFFVVAPGTVVGVIPWLIAGGEFREPAPHWAVARVVGLVLICAGLIPVVHAFAEFTKAGGTPAPIAPTERLVVTGFNRYIRNPMYAGLLVVIVGEALVYGRFALLVYAACAWAVTAAFVRWYEEPTLARTYGADYDTYRRSVPAWHPRLRPWQAA